MNNNIKTKKFLVKIKKESFKPVEFLDTIQKENERDLEKWRLKVLNFEIDKLENQIDLYKRNIQNFQNKIIQCENQLYDFKLNKKVLNNTIDCKIKKTDEYKKLEMFLFANNIADETSLKLLENLVNKILEEQKENKDRRPIPF